MYFAESFLSVEALFYNALLERHERSPCTTARAL